MEVSICEREGGKKQGNIEWKGWQADSSLNVVNAFSRTHNQEYLHHLREAAPGYKGML